jgi:hypothetical protein
LRARFEKHAATLADIGFMLKGSVNQRFLPCGTPNCRCHSDPSQRHGPYWQWTSKVKGKTVSRMLTEEQARRYQEWITNWKRFEETVNAMHDISAQADAIVRTQENAARTSAKTTPRSRRPLVKSAGRR